MQVAKWIQVNAPRLTQVFMRTGIETLPGMSLGPRSELFHGPAAIHHRTLILDLPMRLDRLGIRVDVRGDQLFLRGQVTGDDQRHLLTEVAQEAAPGLTVHNEVTCVEVRDPGEEEQL